MNYRSDIDGLRALAVTSVIINHAAPEALPSGFLGVDIFFVISGYLITSIILSELDEGRFSVARFYERRLRRIAPALLVVSGACIPAAYLLMHPLGLEKFSQSLLAVLAFVPNIFFWRTVSYFDPSAETLPLLHTWSLGIEEQFYLVFPPILAYLWHRSKRSALLGILTMAAVSLLIAEYWWRSGKGALGFYLLPSRAWELLIGAGMAVLNKCRDRGDDQSLPRGAATFFGAAALLASLIFSNKSIPLPSLYTLAPALGTAAILAANTKDSPIYRILSLKPLTYIGMISYSAYLWHQPLFAFARLYNGKLESYSLLTVIVVLALLSHLTWRFIEQPFRSAGKVGLRRLLVTTVIGVLLLMSFGIWGTASQGFIARLSPEQSSLLREFDKQLQGNYVEKLAKSLEGRPFAGNGKPKVLVIGDSYAQDFLNMTKESGALEGIDASFFYIAGDCQPTPFSKDAEKYVDLKYRSACASRRSALSNLAVVAQTDLVIIASYWRPWGTQLMGSTQAHFLRAGAKQVIFIGMKEFGAPNPTRWIDMPPQARLMIRTQESASVEARNTELARAVGEQNIQRITSGICNDGYCRAFTSNGELISFDGAHLTKAGAAKLGASAWDSQPLAKWKLGRPL